MKKLFALMFAAMFAMSFAACGDDEESFDNKKSCEDWVASFDCGDYDFTAGNEAYCDSYDGIACDLSDLFDCWSDNITCVDGVFGMTAEYASCANLATCD